MNESAPRGLNVCALFVSTSSHFVTVHRRYAKLTFAVNSRPSALTPFFVVLSRRFQIPGLVSNENVTATPLFAAFTRSRAVSPLCSLFAKVTGGVAGQPISVHPSALRGFCSSLEPQASNYPSPCRSLSLLLPLSLQRLQHPLPLFSVAYSLFLQTPRGATLVLPQASSRSGRAWRVRFSPLVPPPTDVWRTSGRHTPLRSVGCPASRGIYRLRVEIRSPWLLDSISSTLPRGQQVRYGRLHLATKPQLRSFSSSGWRQLGRRALPVR